MRQYEVNLIVDPVLSQSEIGATAKTYSDLIKQEGGKVVHVDEMGLKQLAYPIKKRNTGVYYCIEFQVPNGAFLDKLELALRRDERIMRFLSVALDKYGIKYNEDKRNGLIGKVKTKEEKKAENKDQRSGGARSQSSPKPKAEAPKPKAEDKPKAEAPKPKAEDKPKAEAPAKAEDKSGEEE